ncbi:hypothetical protein, partial [Putridiphycobacter roseus]|uniref:hypothetical protein n=1 Tax=Putridiphycobacter roseus TaxID=2219161 RepID=UPI00362DAE07
HCSALINKFNPLIICIDYLGLDNLNVNSCCPLLGLIEQPMAFVIIVLCFLPFSNALITSSVVLASIQKSPDDKRQDSFSI